MAISDKNRREFNPAVSILSWLFVAVAIELATLQQLVWLAAGGVVLLARADVLQRFARLFWRARWLWLALALLYAWTVPGTLVWSSDYSPTWEGIESGLIRVARLVLFVATLARLLSELSPPQLAAGIYLLCKPFAKLGLDRRALAVRLTLTLEKVETRGKGRPWWEELGSPFVDTTGPEVIRITYEEVGLREVLLLSASLLLLGMVVARISA